MKKSLLLVLVVLFTYNITANAAGISLGVKGGLGIANFYGDHVAELEDLSGGNISSRIVFQGGIFADIFFSEVIGIQPEILYLPKGAKLTVVDEGSATLNLTYLEIPLLLKLKIPASPQLSFQILAGPTIGMNIAAKTVTDIPGEDIPDEDIKDEIKSMDMGVSFGAGVGIGLGSSGILTLDGRYTMGLTTITEDDVDLKTNNISIMAGYAFTLVK